MITKMIGSPIIGRRITIWLAMPAGSPLSCPGLFRASTPCDAIETKTLMAATSAAMTAIRSGRRSFRGLRDVDLMREVDHFQRGADALGGAVLETDLGVDRNGVLAAVNRFDDVGVFLVDDAAADLARARQLAIVGVEFLVEQEKAGDALRRRQRGVYRFDFLLQQRVNLLARRKVGIGRKGDPVFLRPFRNDREADADHRRERLAAGAEHDRLGDIGRKLQLVFEILRREALAARGLCEILDAVDDHELLAVVEIAGVAGIQPAIL